MWAWLWAFKRRWNVVQLPEPLWLRALPLTLSVGLAVRVSDLVCRRKTRIVTYAMENNDPLGAVAGYSGRVAGVAFGFVRHLSGWIFDRVALASRGASDCYVASGCCPSRAESNCSTISPGMSR